MAEKRHADVLVIGAGATGAIASLVLGEAGLDIVCLEQGGWVRPEDHPHQARDWEWQSQGIWNSDINIRSGDGDYPVDTDSSQVLMWNAVGGSTNIYGALGRASAYRISARASSTDTRPTGRSVTRTSRLSMTAPTASSASAACTAIRPCRRMAPIPRRSCRSAGRADVWPTPSTVLAGIGGRFRRA